MAGPAARASLTRTKSVGSLNLNFTVGGPPGRAGRRHESPPLFKFNAGPPASPPGRAGGQLETRLASLSDTGTAHGPTVTVRPCSADRDGELGSRRSRSRLPVNLNSKAWPARPARGHHDRLGQWHCQAGTGLLKPGQLSRYPDPPGPDSDSAALTRRAGPGVQLPGVADGSNI